MTNDNQGEQKTMANQNNWTLVKFKDIANYLEKNEVSQIKFAQTLGVSNSTFHNWKGGRSTPDEETQQKILDVIKGKTKIASKPASAARGGRKKTVGKVTTKAKAAKAAKKKTAAKADAPKKRGPGRPKGSKNKPKTAEKVAARTSKGTRRVSRTRTSAGTRRVARPMASSNTDSGNYVDQVVNSYLSNNPIQSLDDLQATLSTIKKAGF